MTPPPPPPPGAARGQSPTQGHRQGRSPGRDRLRVGVGVLGIGGGVIHGHLGDEGTCTYTFTII